MEKLSNEFNTLDRYNRAIFAYQYEYSEGEGSCFGDIEYYIKKCSGQGKNVLELGCGTGRITIPLKLNDIDITGLDHAAEMIKIAKDKSVKKSCKINWIVDNAINFELNKKFTTIFIPYNSISFINANDLDVFAINIKRHLCERGSFLFDLSRSNFYEYDKNNTRLVPWCEEIFIKELAVYLKRKIKLILIKELNLVKSIYYWHIRYKNTNEIKEFETQMDFSVLSPEYLIDFFTNHGFKLAEHRKQKYQRAGAERIHSFVELILA